MSDCELLAVCPFFHDQLAGMPASAGLLKTRFCQGRWQACARYRVSQGLGRERVPRDLSPHQAEVAETLLQA
jgi:hypothetical protein